MFLDRLGQQADRSIIQFLGVRLMAGQGSSGGWSYDCGYPLNAQDEASLKTMFIKESRLVSAPAKKDLPAADPVKKQPGKVVARPDLSPDEIPPLPPKPEPKTVPAKNDPPAVAKPAVEKPVEEKPALHPQVLRFAKLINQDAARSGKDFGLPGDNSNTQFATLGLWCARKHGLPCEKSLALLETRFRTSQDADGGWAYHYASGGGGSAPAMTCAGLIALAVAHGSHQSVLKNKVDAPAPKANANPKKGPVDPEDDEAIKKGLKCLGNYITNAKGLPPEGKINPAIRRKRFKIDDLNGNLYFLWSLERTAVIYGLETVGKHDWYVWGSDALLDSQNANGSWSNQGYHGANDEISTSFALLFLNRANVARDLSTVLQGKVRDPGTAVLRSADLSKILPDQVAPKTQPKRDPVAVIDPRPEPMTSPPPAQTGGDVDAEAARLSATLLNAAGDARVTLLAKLRDSKGSVYTDALARAAAKATSEFQQEIREALARRLTRMTPATLREMLKDDNREIRRGAALACGHKEDRQFIADLIELVGDSEEVVVQASRTSLRALTGKDLGPGPAAAPADRQKATLAWKNWWKEQQR
jgi:hypothetical protein